MGLVKRKIVFFYDFLPGSTTFVLWRTAKTWMQPSTKTKDTFEPSNETVFDEKTVHGRKQMYKWECKAAGRAFLGTTSQALRASSPGRGAIGRPGKFCCSLGPNWAQSTGPCPHWQRHLYCCYESRQRSPVVPGSEKLRSSSTTATDSPVAPLFRGAGAKRLRGCTPSFHLQKLKFISASV